MPVDGNLLLNASGHIVLAGAARKLASPSNDACACCTSCTEEFVGYKLRYSDTWVSQGYQVFSGGVRVHPYLSVKDDCHLWIGVCCQRLFIWERRTVTGGVYGGAAAHDWCLRTNNTGAKTWGPNDRDPFETTVGSGTDLDTEPYWWVGCRTGGWESLGSMWYNPTLTQIQPLIGSSLVNGTWTLFALVRYKHWETREFDPPVVGAPPYAGNQVLPDNKGNVVLKWLRHLKH